MFVHHNSNRAPHFIKNFFIGLEMESVISSVASYRFFSSVQKTMRHRLIFIIDLSRALVTRLSFLLTQFPSFALRCCCAAGYKTEICWASAQHRVNFRFSPQHSLSISSSSWLVVSRVKCDNKDDQQSAEKRRRKNCWAEGRCNHRTSLWLTELHLQFFAWFYL